MVLEYVETPEQKYQDVEIEFERTQVNELVDCIRVRFDLYMQIQLMRDRQYQR
jgi:hypothetical protein